MPKAQSSRINENLKFNVLGDIFDTLRFRGSIFFRSKLAAPWGMSLEKEDNPRFHIALDGDFFIGASNTNEEVTHVNKMGIIMLPQGDKHWVSDQLNRQLIPSEQAGKACELNNPLFQKGKITNNLMCGQVYYDKEILHPILDSLPSVLHFPSLERSDPIWMTVILINAEMDRVKANKTSIIDRLTEVLFLQLLNKYMSENEEVSGFFAALRNHRVHLVLGLIHQDPQNQWSLKSLGDKAGMSRATLARQFKSVVGIPPMVYLSNWRMMKAHHLLKHSRYSVEQIADTVGFSTARTLNKAFLRHYGYTPSKLRRK